MIDYCPNCHRDVQYRAEDRYNPFDQFGTFTKMRPLQAPHPLRCECGFPIAGVVITREIQDGKVRRESWWWPEWKCTRCGISVPEGQKHRCA
jgi:hypothetical protein